MRSSERRRQREREDLRDEERDWETERERQFQDGDAHFGASLYSSFCVNTQIGLLLKFHCTMIIKNLRGGQRLGERQRREDIGNK